MKASSKENLRATYSIIEEQSSFATSACDDRVLAEVENLAEQAFGLALLVRLPVLIETYLEAVVIVPVVILLVRTIQRGSHRRV